MNSIIIFIKKHCQSIAYFSILLLTASIIIQPPTDWWDTWFHLKIGETILNQKQILTTDIFSYTAFGELYFTHEWLSQVFIFIFFNLSSFFGLKVLVISVFTLTMGIWYKTLRGQDTAPFLSLLLVLFTTFCTRPFWQPRPQIFSFLFIAVLFYIYTSFTNKHKLIIVLSFLVSLAWANFHATAVIAPLIGIYYLIATSVRQKKLAKSYLWSSLLSFLATLLNPSGIRIYTYLLEKNVYAITKNVSEFKSLLAYSNEIVPQVYMVFIIPSVIFILYSMFKKTVKTKGQKIGLICGLVVLLSPLIAYRLLPLALLSGGVLLSSLLAAVADWDLVKNSKVKLLLFIAVVLLCLGLTVNNVSSKIFNRQPDFDFFPLGAADFIEENNLQGNMYNPYDWGGYLLWRLGPNKKVFIDGRMDIYAKTEVPASLNRLFDFLNNPNSRREDIEDVWNKLLDSYNINYVVLHTYDDRVLGELTLQKDGWFLVYFDKTASILVKMDDKNNGLSTKKFTAADPFAVVPYKTDKRESAIAEYEAYLSEYPDNIAAEILLSIILIEKGDYTPAEKHLNSAIAEDKNNATAYYNLGLVYIGKEDYQNALVNFEKCIRLNPSFAYAYKNAAKLSLEKIPDRNKAIRYYKTYLKLNPTDEERDTIEKILREI